MLEDNNNLNSDTSSVASAAVAAENNNDASSITFVDAFAAIGVAATVDDEEQLKQPPPSNLPCPFSKIQKKPSSCMTGTPSSAQRPTKFRQSTSTQTPPTTVCQLSSTQTEIAPIDEFNLLLPPTISSQFNQDRASQQMFLCQYTENSSINIQLDARSDDIVFHQSFTAEVKNRFNGFKFMIGIPVKNGAVPGFKKGYTVEELVAKERIMKDGLWATKNNRCKHSTDVEEVDDGAKHGCNDTSLLTENACEKTDNKIELKERATRGFYGKKIHGVEEIARYSCKAKRCKCQLLIARIAGGLLAYERIDVDTFEPYEHTGHDTLDSLSKKLDCYSLTHCQQVYVLNDGAVLANQKDWLALARTMIMDPFVRVTHSQASSESTFSQRIKYFVQREKKKGRGLAAAAEKMMTGTQIEAILNCLQETNRNNRPLDHSMPFMQTMDFNALWKNIRVTDHNYKWSKSSNRGITSYSSCTQEQVIHCVYSVHCKSMQYLTKDASGGSCLS